MRPGDRPWESGVAQTPSDVSMQGPGGKEEGKRVMEGDGELNQESVRNTIHIFGGWYWPAQILNQDGL